MHVSKFEFYQTLQSMFTAKCYDNANVWDCSQSVRESSGLDEGEGEGIERTEPETRRGSSANFRRNQPRAKRTA